jgi:hypothetical protein
VEGDRVTVDAAPGEAELQFRKSQPAPVQEEVLQQ